MPVNDEASFKVLSAVEKHEGQVDLAKDLGFSVGKVNYILKALVEKGFVKMSNFTTSTSKRKYKYLLTPDGIKEKIALTESFIERKKAEYEQLQQQLVEAKCQQYDATASHQKESKRKMESKA
ncbi:MAG: MarR family EPS-associated transcriptional regulator [Helicobacteraceae bacterium]|nr:MarR family EPS-associated transcriptional regulator [Helicobacteraceae bacterium]